MLVIQQPFMLNKIDNILVKLQFYLIKIYL